VLTAKGIQNGKEILDVIYSDYDNEVPDEVKLMQIFKVFFNYKKLRFI
jgi:hypothetical protein